MTANRGKPGSESDTDADSESGSDSDSGSSWSDSGSSGDSTSNSGSGSSSSGSSSNGDNDSSDRGNFEVGFWQSLRAVLPWTEEGKEADYAEERLDAQAEFQEELDEALLIRKMVEMGLHDRALERLMAVTEGQMYHDFHKHRYVLEQSGAWSFVPPSVQRKWRVAVDRTGKVEKLRAYMAMRRDRFLRIRALCAQVRGANLKSRDTVVTIVPRELVDGDLLAIASKADQKKVNPGGKLKKCHWHGVGPRGEACTCTNYRMVHPHRLFKDEFGVMVHDTLTTCGWHATHCVSNVHGNDPVVVSTANEGALCNECLAQIVKGPLRQTTFFGAPGVRVKSKLRGEPGDADTGDEPLAWNKWFTKGPGRFRKDALRPRHPNAPPGYPPVGLSPAAVYVPPPPPPPTFSMANFRRHQKLAKWKLRKEAEGGRAATNAQRIYRGYRVRHQRAMAALEHPVRALNRVESAIVMQSLVRRFLARSLVLQIVAFREDSATTIQRIVRGVQARALYRRKRAQVLVNRQMLFYLARSYMASAKVAKRIREEMRKKHAVALSLQRVWRGRRGREVAARLRAWRMRREGAAIISQKAFRSWLARRELQRRKEAHRALVEAAIKAQSGFRMAIARTYVKKKRAKLLVAALRIQPLVRGFLAKRHARRERAMVDQAWKWLGIDSRTANNMYSRFLPKNAYAISRGGDVSNSAVEITAIRGREASGEEDTSLVPAAVSASSTPTLVLASSSVLKKLPGEEHFTDRFDKERTGTCTKVEFKLALVSFCRSQGYPLQKEEAATIFNRYYDGDGFCGWHSFLTTYHAGKGGNDACARHGKLQCALCVRHGGCGKAGCACAKAKASRSKQLGFKMCECGHPFDVHQLLAGVAAADGRELNTSKVIAEKKFDSLLTGSLTVFSTDRPIDVEGCSATPPTAVACKNARSFKAPPYSKHRRSRKPGRSRRLQLARNEHRPSQNTPEFEKGRGGGFTSPVNAVCVSSPGCKGDTNPAVSPSRGKHKLQHMGFEELPLSPPSGLSTTSLLARKLQLPTMQQAKHDEITRRDNSWAGRKGQAGRAAKVQMNDASQGRNAAEYALRLQADLAANEAMWEGQSSSLARVQSRKELRHGFMISDPVPFVKDGTLKATVDPVGLYLYLLKALSDERHDLLEDARRFTDFVMRHAVFFERHWCKLVKDIRNGRPDPHLPISAEKRAKVETLMIPSKKRAQQLDDALRVLGFHARASGTYQTDIGSTKRSRKATTGTLTQEEKEESMTTRVKASRKRCGKDDGDTDVGGTRVRRRTVGGGELESDARLTRSRERARARSPSAGAIQKIPTTEEASQTAYELLTAASDAPAGVIQAPSGRNVRKYVCLYPGCGKVFHLKASATAHQEEEHQFKRRLATTTPLTDQFLSTAWPSDGVPWVSKTGLSSALRQRSAVHGAKTPDLHLDSAQGRLPCRVPGCDRRFASSRLLGLHLRMGHNAFDLEKMNQAERWASEDDSFGGPLGEAGPGATITLDGLSITNWTPVGGNVQARFVGKYRLVPPFVPPSECPAIPACAQHYWMKTGCSRCMDVQEGAAPAIAGSGLPQYRPEAGSGVEQSKGTDKSGVPKAVLGLPLTPVKFYTRARVRVRHHGRPVELDLDTAAPLRCAVIAYPAALLHTSASPVAHDPSSSQISCAPLRHHLDVERSHHEPVPKRWGCPATGVTADGRRRVVDNADRCNTDSESSAGGNLVRVVVGQKATTVGPAAVEEAERMLQTLNQRTDQEKTAPTNSAACSALDTESPPGCSREESRDGSGGSGHRLRSRGEIKRSKRHEVRARILAVLVDGVGKGWLAVRRLWSAAETPSGALSQAGLSVRDLDAQQEFFVAENVEYIPLSLVMGTCTVMASRRDDVHAKQLLGDLPKSVRFVCHGFDSVNGVVLSEAEMKLRAQQLMEAKTTGG